MFINCPHRHILLCLFHLLHVCRINKRWLSKAKETFKSVRNSVEAEWKFKHMDGKQSAVILNNQAHLGTMESLYLTVLAKKHHLLYSLSETLHCTPQSLLFNHVIRYLYYQSFPLCIFGGHLPCNYSNVNSHADD